ncbi:MAG: phosphatidylserine/phosphatidylglycerophosphate/cardiolipin synthase-like protein [Acidimicrobiaceae bacterium]|nr:phosphatidylserine/phosphatidylglycerophosphate/cardiolipin synthase-like protein [Acidimicrobiaceae bacterium]
MLRVPSSSGRAVLVATALFLGGYAPAAPYSPSAGRTPDRTTGPAAVTSGLTLLTEPDAGMAPIYRLLASPRHSLDMVMYELDDGSAEAILAADAARGVRVRVLLDRAEVGAVNVRARSFLVAHGVAVRFASTRYQLTHEKSFVIDGRTALVMSLNLGPAAYEAVDRDFAVVDQLPADVASMDVTFEADWRGVPISAPQGSDLLWSPGAEAALTALLASARTSLLVESEEMEDPVVVSALEAAAERGVRVVVVMTKQARWAASFHALAHAGVEVRTYPDSAAALYIHAKAIVVDPGRADARVFVGSQNLSYVSLAFNRELGVVTSDPAIIRTVAGVIVSDAHGAGAWR